MIVGDWLGVCVGVLSCVGVWDGVAELLALLLADMDSDGDWLADCVGVCEGVFDWVRV